MLIIEKGKLIIVLNFNYTYVYILLCISIDICISKREIYGYIDIFLKYTRIEYN